MLIGGAEGHEACHRARKGMLIGGAERQEAYHWARYGMLIGGADEATVSLARLMKSQQATRYNSRCQLHRDSLVGTVEKLPIDTAVWANSFAPAPQPPPSTAPG